MGKIYTIERIEALLERAKLRIKELQLRNVRFKHGDGYEGWSLGAPYDGILVAAAPLSVPESLLAQLAVGGRLVMPVGGEGRQQLLRLTRTEEGVTREILGVVSFVPLQSGTIQA